jgi:outer membrane protein assembly factor BamB
VLYAVRPDSGRLVWQLYLGDEQKVSANLPSAHRAQGERCEWEVPSGSPLYSPPAIADDGTILIGSGQGFLFAIGEAAQLR